jgi:hypothetical protein
MHRIVPAVVAALALMLAAPASSGAAKSCPKPPPLPDADTFVGPVDNPYLPLKPGTTWTYNGKLDGESAKDVVSVTSENKTILDVKVTVVQDQVFVKNKLVEDTDDWFAQDGDGNVW